MGSSIIAMLLWIGGMSGGPAIISGFESLQACKEAIPIVTKSKTYDQFSKQAECVELKK